MKTCHPLISPRHLRYARSARSPPPPRRSRDRGTPDAGANGNANLYGAWPLLIWVDARDGSAGAVFFASSAAMDVTLHRARDGADAARGEAGALAQFATFRAAGGALDVFAFAAPSPDALLPAVHALFGLPAFPPRWALGFHVCRW